MYHEIMSLKKNQMGMDPIKSPPSNPFNTGRRKSPESLTRFHIREFGTEPQLLLWNNFCHHVGCILVCVNLLQLEAFHFFSITNLMIYDFNMLYPGVIGGILAQVAQVYCTLTIAIYHIPILFHTQFLEISLDPQYLFASFNGSYILNFSCR